MRRAYTTAEPERAQAFGDYLLVRGIDNQVDPATDGHWEVWVHAEEHLAPAARLLAEFEQRPARDAWDELRRQADRLRKAQAREERAAAGRMKGRDELFKAAVPWFTFTLIGLCVLVALWSRMGRDPAAVAQLAISKYRVLQGVPWWKGLPEIRAGQVWRLATPAFLHFGFLHLVFNMLWLRDLGGMVERVQGVGRLAALVLAITLCSNLAQYAVSGPLFGGMSGVVYGLLGYIWMQGRHAPASGLYLHSSTVTMMLAWFFICLLGFLPIANTVHAVGLGMGVAWGYLAARWRARP